MRVSLGMFIGSDEDDWGKDMYADKERFGLGSLAAVRSVGGVAVEIEARKRSRGSWSDMTGESFVVVDIASRNPRSGGSRAEAICLIAVALPYDAFLLILSSFHFHT